MPGDIYLTPEAVIVWMDELREQEMLQPVLELLRDSSWRPGSHGRGLGTGYDLIPSQHEDLTMRVTLGCLLDGELIGIRGLRRTGVRRKGKLSFAAKEQGRLEVCLIESLGEAPVQAFHGKRRRTATRRSVAWRMAGSYCGPFLRVCLDGLAGKSQLRPPVLVEIRSAACCWIGGQSGTVLRRLECRW